MERLDFFFYGTLRDAEVRRVVLGPSSRTREVYPASVRGRRAAPVARGRYPALVDDPAAHAPGLLVPDVDLVAAARLSFFEGEGEAGGDYRVERIGIEAGRRGLQAWAYLPTAALRVEPGNWDIDDWARRHRAAFLRATHATMRGFRGRAAAAELEKWKKRVRAGQAGRLTTPTPRGGSPGRERHGP